MYKGNPFLLTAVSLVQVIFEVKLYCGLFPLKITT